MKNNQYKQNKEREHEFVKKTFEKLLADEDKMKYLAYSTQMIPSIIKYTKQAELKGIKEGKAQILADFIKIIDECPCGRKDREWINVKELKAKLQSPNKSASSHSKGEIDTNRLQTGSDNIQKAISEFKEKLKERFVASVLTKRYVIETIDKTAQDITG